MSTPTDRRHFMKLAGAGLASGMVGAAVSKGEDAPPAVPLPDGDTDAPAPGAQPAVCACVCDPASTLIFACSGAADTGALADQAARRLMKDGVGKMYCLAGVGGRIDPLMKGTATAETILAIDGCPLNCTRQTLEKAGFTVSQHICVTELGFVKGETPMTEKNVAQVVAAGKKALGA